MCTLYNMEFLPSNIAFKIKMHINQSRTFVLKNKKNKIKNTAKFCVMWETNQDKKFALLHPLSPRPYPWAFSQTVKIFSHK